MTLSQNRRPTDTLLLLEAGLVLLFIGLFLVLYFVPAGAGTLLPQWWAWPVLAGLFFGILLLERARRKRRESARMSSALRLEPEPEDETR
jgi:hypothetical protein